MVQAKVWKIKTVSQGVPKESDFECVTETVPPCENGDIIVEAEWISVDPYQRYRIAASKPGDGVFGSQVAKVIESKNPDCPVGSYVVTYPGWRSHSRISKEEMKDQFRFTKLSDLEGIRRSAALGILGMPGLLAPTVTIGLHGIWVATQEWIKRLLHVVFNSIPSRTSIKPGASQKPNGNVSPHSSALPCHLVCNTAYFGLLDICDPKAGETVVVNAAAGAVGSAVCQIAKIKGCKVVAFAGSPAKVAYVKSLGIDHVFNYKTEDISKVLSTAAPDGVHCYFDNVGGDFTASVLPHMVEMGRVSVCGAISTYNQQLAPGEKPSGPFASSIIIPKQLKVEGFMVYRWASRWMEGIHQLVKWIKEGKLKYEETVTEGFENVPKTFIGLFQGENMGKAVIKY
ncbi:Alcohol dehydrogenase C-terminal [Trinorchestia longiramus]|nr:Alcohol dehydrogenase C-terminal [Trinorchestia longiramus]